MMPHECILACYALVASGHLEEEKANLLLVLAANGLNTVWECYVAGLDPTNATDLFRTVISFDGNSPKISWDPRLASDEEAKRAYTIHGREKLEEGGWTTPTNALHRFFKVGVEMR